MKRTERIAITERQKELSYAKYYYKELAPIGEEKLQYSEQPMNPKKALRIQERNRLFETGYFEIETGYCVMEDGTGYVANYTLMPGVTVDMFDWWFAWHGLGELRYTIWDPEDHYSAVSTSLVQGRSPELSLKEKYWGTTHLICEDIGAGPADLFASFKNPSEMGFDKELIETSLCGTIVTANSGVRNDPGASAEVMCHFVREVEGGIELRSRFWLGWHIINGREVRMQPKNETTPLEKPRLLLKHNMKEFANLANLLPQIFEEEKDNWN